MNYIKLHNAETGNEVIVFLHSVFFIEENMIMGNNPENKIFVKETAEEINNILLSEVYGIGWRNRMTQEEAIKTVDRIFNYCEEIDCHLPEDEQTGYDMYPDIRAVMEYIRNTPEIVRCKDCKHRRQVDDTWFYCEEIYSNMSGLHKRVDDDFYCKDGERIETE